MMKIRLVSAAILLVASQASAMAEGEPSIYESATPPTATNQLDRIVFARLSSLGFRLVLCSDAVFVRRAYLDLIGTLPTAQEAREFIQDPDAKNKPYDQFVREMLTSSRRRVAHGGFLRPESGRM